MSTFPLQQIAVGSTLVSVELRLW